VTVTNLPASIRAKLLQRARETGRRFQELLQYFAMERFLYRLSRSRHRQSFVLKGAVMLRVWNAPLARPTKDLDFLAYGPSDVDSVVAVAKEICDVEVEPDGLIFGAETVEGTRIKEDAEYEGVRIKFTAKLEKAVAHMQLDVAFGDVVVPAVSDVEFPVMLSHAAPRLRAYPRETVIAEKYQAMVFLGTMNSRMKDFYDVWLLARQFEFDGATLLSATKATFANRGTAIEAAPVAFTEAFTSAAATQAQWSAFMRRLGVKTPASLKEATELIATFLGPVAQAALDGVDFAMRWVAPGVWRR